ncbi:MAG: YbaN family protein [Pirellulales bacterium]|nr:YbaN family protein [Pirellulales bacterium]
MAPSPTIRRARLHSRSETTRQADLEAQRWQTLDVAEAALDVECREATVPSQEIDREGPQQVDQVQGIRRAVYVGLALAFLAIGLVGAVLPGLPTTPFLLLTSYFLVRSSPALHARVMRIPVVGRFVNDWREKRGVRPRVKLLAVVTVLAVVGCSLALSVLPAFLKFVITGLAAVGLTVIWRLPTIAD